MSTNVGSLNATLSLSAFEFQNGLKQSETAAMQFATTTEVASRRADTAIASVGKGNGIASGARALQQVGFGIQDFSSQFETRGLAGGIAAVTNNVQMLGAAFGPVGLAVSAVGGALAGIFLPKLIESSGVFGASKTELKAYADQLEQTYEQFRKFETARFTFLEQPVASLDKALQGMRNQAAILYEQWVAQNEAARQLIEKGDLPNAQIAIDAREKTAQEQADVIKEGKALAALRPEVAAAEEQRKQAKDAADKEQQYLRSLKTGNEELNKLRKDGLEQYGTEREKLASKQLREMEEFKAKTKDLGGTQQDQARSAMEASQAAEMKKVEISEEAKKIAELGTAAKGSAGVDLASSAGVQAINRAVSGTRSEQDLAKQAQKTREAQLKALETIAREKASVIQVSLSG